MPVPELSRLYPYWVFTKNLIFGHQIRSDMDISDKVEYSLTGEGADHPPFNLFVVNSDNGFVRITGLLDREKKASYNVSFMGSINNMTESEL